MSDNGKRLADFCPQKVNANKGKPIGLTQLDKSIRRDGYSAPMVAAADGEIFAGSKRLERAAEIFGLDIAPIVVHSDGTRPVIHVRDDIPTADDPRAVRLGVADNAIAHIDYDPDGAILATLAAQDEAIAEMVRCDDVSKSSVLSFYSGVDVEVVSEQPISPPEDGLFLEQRNVPDAIWPTDNDFGIPLLDFNMQADALDQPVILWATGKAVSARLTRMRGTWLFYTEDARFEILWKNPVPVANSGCVALVEPNFSCYSNMPKAVWLWAIYRKRWLARYWQSFGIKVFVDLNVCAESAEFNLLGVPLGWRAYCTRGYGERLAETEREIEIAKQHAMTQSILFVVYDGGKAVKDFCGKRDLIWIPEDRDVAGNRPILKGGDQHVAG